ncbi:heme-binding protein, partial [Gammaproteobacteria bacterium]|nr:heme-binding protein [Gammaproteobacteria bacterium]
MGRTPRSLSYSKSQQARGSLQLVQGALLSLFLIAAADSYGLETPEYEVLYTEGDIEYRRYEAYLVAETSIAEVGDWGKDTRDGFMQLFDYITGDNTLEITGDNTLETKIETTTLAVQGQSTKIAMTAPVVESSSNGVNRMAFMLPSEYQLDNAPRPTNPAITLKEMPVRLIASIRYSGRWTDKNVAKYKAQLEQHLAANKVNVIGEFSTAVYNAPFTPPFMRRNEIHYEISALP